MKNGKKSELNSKMTLNEIIRNWVYFGVKLQQRVQRVTIFSRPRKDYTIAHLCYIRLSTEILQLAADPNSKKFSAAKIILK